MILGDRFKFYREKVELTQKEAANLLGVKNYQLANYETGRTEPNIATLLKMSSIYNVSLDELLNNQRKINKNRHSEDYNNLLIELNNFLKNIDKN